MYIPQSWVDEATDLSAARFNHMEAGISQAEKRAVLVAGTTSAFDETNSVRWADADGGLVAEIDGWRQLGASPHSGAALHSYAPNTGGATAQTNIQADLTGTGAKSALLQVVARNDKGLAVAVADNQTRTILDGTGKSDFIQDAPLGRRVRHWGPYSFGVTVNAGASLNIDWPVPVELRPLSQFTSFFIDLEMVGISTGGFFEQVGVSRADVVLNAGAANEALRWWFHQFAGSQGQGTMKFWIRTVG